MLDWSKYNNFSKKEFDCKQTGINRMRPEFMEVLQQIRTTWGKPMTVNSGYRHSSHPVEVNKEKLGEHTYGVAVDIAIGGADFLELMAVAYGYGIRRMGIVQKGNDRFLHLGTGDKELGFPAVGWTY